MALPPAYFAAQLSALAAVFFFATRAPRALLALVLLSSAFILARAPMSPAERAKVAAELPLGLGAVLAFPLLPPGPRARLLPRFSRFVDAAVLANVAGPGADAAMAGVAWCVAGYAAYRTWRM
ncbi:hypothetical protein DFJ74DRAFT_700583 [Hyaloraphidium curvatum]|nr:hypothetical protein DFJ74DRAFT_714771 [Hyaloraphidium curvatum]KAI9034186.1 hypothetical protein DFJ74DRAFT_700583 [Hyaloraphidium curvatum]